MDQTREAYDRYGQDDLNICDTVCEGCAFRWEEDPARCRKYPRGKPESVLDPDRLCPFFTVVDLEE